MKGALFALILIGYCVAGISIAVNARYGQRMSVDADGIWMSALLLACAVAPAALSSVSGWLYRTRRWAVGSLVFVMALGFVGFSCWNAGDFAADQMVGKVKLSERKAKAAADAAEIQNNTILQDRKDLKEMLMRTFVTQKTEQGKDAALKAVEALTDKPIALVAPSVEIAVSDARASFAHKWLGWDKEVVQGISPAVMPLMMALMEVLFPILGWGLWPRGKSSTELRRNPMQFPRDRARFDVLDQIAKGAELCVSDYAERWGHSPSKASRWLDDFEREKVCRKVTRNGRKIAVAPKPGGSNGRGTAVH